MIVYLLTAFALVSLASAAIGAILEHIYDEIHYDRRHNHHQ